MPDDQSEVIAAQLRVDLLGVLVDANLSIDSESVHDTLEEFPHARAGYPKSSFHGLPPAPGALLLLARRRWRRCRPASPRVGADRGRLGLLGSAAQQCAQTAALPGPVGHRFGLGAAAASTSSATFAPSGTGPGCRCCRNRSHGTDTFSNDVLLGDRPCVRRDPVH